MLNIQKRLLQIWRYSISCYSESQFVLPNLPDHQTTFTLSRNIQSIPRLYELHILLQHIQSYARLRGIQ